MTRVGFHMLKTWSFWKTFFTVYLALVGGIQVFADPYISFEGESLKQLLGSNWWVYYYLIPFVIAFSIAALRNEPVKTPDKTLDQRNRRVMLDHVENFWVKGILEKSLHGVALLGLGIKEDPSALNYPWTIKRESTDENIPVGKSMLEIFHEIGLGHSLLILGAPGSGKTTMLLELTRQLVKLSRENETEPLPVVFNLASWTEKLSLADWLVEQLNIVYSVPKRIAPSWVQGNKMLLLLDGLDEVKADSRVKCIEIINQFRNQYGLTPLVVCSRIEEYRGIKTKLSLEGAIILQPLTSDQINSYINRFGNSLASVRMLLSKDEVLRELAETPLMLSIMALAYKDINTNDLVALNNVEEHRKHLFNAYIQRMFGHPARHISPDFTEQETLHYLNYLARTMIRHNIITYQIESMQPSWLEEQPQRRLYKLYAGLLFGLVVGLTLGLGVGLHDGLLDGLLGGLIGGLTLGLFFGLFDKLKFIHMADKLIWSWRGAQKGLLGGLGVGLLFGLISGLNFGLGTGLSSGLLFGSILGLISEQVEETTYPGQRFKQTLSNALLVTLIVGLGAGLSFGLSVGLSVGLSAGPLVGLLFGLLGGLFFGLISIIQHISLRWVLARYHLLPYHLLTFLEFSVDLIFLRRVGGSYIFVHRLLIEHFAGMDVEFFETKG